MRAAGSSSEGVGFGWKKFLEIRSGFRKLGTQEVGVLSVHKSPEKVMQRGGSPCVRRQWEEMRAEHVKGIF